MAKAPRAWWLRTASVCQQSFDRDDEFGGARDELSGFLAARWCRLVVAFLAGSLGPASKGAELLVELAGRDEDLTEQRPDAVVGLRELPRSERAARAA